jgi:hypothetical protein
MKAKKILNSFAKGLFKDAHPSSQPDGTIPYALNAVKQNDDSSNIGLYNEKSTELFCSLKEGFILRGYASIEELDSWVVFSYNIDKNESEIGLVNIKEQTYVTHLNDSTLDCRLCFGLEEWIPIEVKRLQDSCTEHVVYWSNKGIYRRLNLNDSKM